MHSQQPAVFSPERPSRRVDDDDDDGEPSRLRTPLAARFADASDAQQAAQPQYPPLEQKASIATLRERFELVMAGRASLLPANVKDFKPETARSELKQHLRDHNIQKDTDYSAGGTLQPIVIQRPAFDQTIFYVRPPQRRAEGEGELEEVPIETLHFYSVPNRALGALMARRGYRKIGIIHLPEDETKLPPAWDADAVASRGVRGSGSTERDLYPAPRELRVPKKVIPIDQSARAPTVAAQIVEAFELKVLVPKLNGGFDVYSPMRLWTRRARTSAEFQVNQSTPFGMRCTLYYYIRGVLSDRDPSEIEMTLDEMRESEGVAALKARKASKSGKRKQTRKGAGMDGDPESSGAGVEAGVDEPEAVADGEDLLKGDWFDLAVDLSRQFVS